MKTVKEISVTVAIRCRLPPCKPVRHPLCTARAEQAPTGIRRGGRVVECTALEMRHTCKGIVGSNPTLSAILH